MPELSQHISPDFKLRSQNFMRRLIDQRVLGSGVVFSEQDASKPLSSMDTRQRTDLFYEKLMAYANTQKAILDEKRDKPDVEPVPPDPYLMSEMKYLWEDKQVQEMFLSKFADARLDLKQYKLSELGVNWQRINQEIASSQKEYGELNKIPFSSGNNTT